MGRLSGFRYRDIVRKLKHFGFIFDRQAAGSHEIMKNLNSNPVNIIEDDMLPEYDVANMPGGVILSARRLAERKRMELAEQIRLARAEYARGEIRAGTIADLMKNVNEVGVSST